MVPVTPRSTDFTKCMENTQLSVSHRLDAELEARKKNNMGVLEMIVDTVLFCGRQNLALRGYRDDSRHSADPALNTGNFKARQVDITPCPQMK